MLLALNRWEYCIEEMLTEESEDQLRHNCRLSCYISKYHNVAGGSDPRIQSTFRVPESSCEVPHDDIGNFLLIPCSSQSKLGRQKEITYSNNILASGIIKVRVLITPKFSIVAPQSPDITPQFTRARRKTNSRTRLQSHTEFYITVCIDLAPSWC